MLSLLVIVPDGDCCQNSGDRVILTENKGLISNHVSQLSGCGVTDCPWFLEAPTGKMLNISLYDFSTVKMVSAFNTWNNYE